MPDPIDAVIGIIKSCKSAKDRAVQNQEAVRASRGRHRGRRAHPGEHRERLDDRSKKVSKLKEVIEEAQKLIQKQSKRSSFITQMCFSSSFKEDFDWVEKRVFQHMEIIHFNRYTPVSVDTSSPRHAQKLNAVAPDAPGPEGDMQILGKWCSSALTCRELLASLTSIRKQRRVGRGSGWSWMTRDGSRSSNGMKKIGVFVAGSCRPRATQRTVGIEPPE